MIRRASSGANTSYRTAGLWVDRLSTTRVMRSAAGYHSSLIRRSSRAKSAFVFRSVTSTRRVPVSGSNAMNRLAVPWRVYS